jgi:DNA-binding MarR family transcriptional regulator
VAEEPQAVDGELLGELLRAYARAVQRVNLALARALGIPPTDVWAMEHLLSAGELGPVELGNRLGIRSASATTLVDRLERAGHAQRRRHDVDRRRLVVVPTEEGAEAVGTAFAPLAEALDAAGEELTPEGRAAVARYLRRVTAALEGYSAAKEG